MGVHDPNHDGAAISEAAGIYVDSNSVITNTIVWNNSPDQLHGQDCNKVTYSDINDDICSNGLGNILADPLFVNPANKDYHLKSAAGRWDPNSQSWVYDNVISPCIDAGDPNSDWTAELWPHGNRINMGAYGGTAQASMSLSKVGNLADLNRDNFVDIDDLVLLFSKWLTEKSLLVEDLNLDGVVDFRDYAIFAENWLQRSYVIIAKFALDINPGWTTQGQWQFGPPMGMGGLSHGYPDPNAAYTGQNVYGVNLNGDYTVAVGGALLFNSRSFQLPAILRYQVEICQVAKYR
jgi:hypothetical protein